MQLQTVNVIGINSDMGIESLKSWEDNEEGNREAEAYFRKTLKEIEMVEDEGEIECALEDGVWESPDMEFNLIISHSTCPTV